MRDDLADIVFTTNYTSLNGHKLPVRAVLQTRDGYIWVATFNGLAGFDGVHFQRFSDVDTPALRNSLMMAILLFALGWSSFYRIM